MSDLQKAWVRNRLNGVPIEPFDELDEEVAEESNNHVSELAEHIADDDSSSASSASSTGTIIPSPSQNLFARLQGWVALGCCTPVSPSFVLTCQLQGPKRKCIQARPVDILL